MPVNSFEDYPMAWKPERAKLERPYYLSLAQQLERDISEGRLPENTKLPPQRELADYLDLNLSTVTRAYKLCELKGLLYGVTGSGTFVAPGVHSEDTFLDKGSMQIEMGMIKPFYETDSVVRDAARAVLERQDACRLFEYSSPLGTERQLDAARLWLRKLGTEADEDRLMIVAGAQNALSVILISLFKAGDKIAVDEFTYTNFKSLANLLQIQLIAVEGDDCGMLPEALNTLCRNTALRGIYLMPACSNPTGIFMPQSRREELAEVIGRYQLLVIEDDIYSFLAPARTESFYSLLPENTFHICSISKSLCAGLRVAFLAFPEAFREPLISGMLCINLKTVSLNAEIIAELILSGEADRVAGEKLVLAKRRGRSFERYFPVEKGDIPRFFHWVRLPQGLGSQEAELLALRRGLHILGSHRFAMGKHNSPAYIRASIVSPRSEAELERGLKLLWEIVQGGSHGCGDFYC